MYRVFCLSQLNNVFFRLRPQFELMHLGITVQNSQSHKNAQHLVIQVDDNLFDELEEIFTVRNAEEDLDEEEEKKTENVIDLSPYLNVPTADDRKYIIHFICDLHCTTLKLLADAIEMYSEYFIQLHISLSSQIDVNANDTNQFLLNTLTTPNTNPQQISMHIDNLKNTILTNKLSLNSFHLYVNIVSNIYNSVYSQLLQIMNDELFDKFMKFNHQNQSLALILGIVYIHSSFNKLLNPWIIFNVGLSEENVKILNENDNKQGDDHNDCNGHNYYNYWNDVHNFLSNSSYINHAELVVKTQSSLYTQSQSHGIIFNELLNSLQCNDNNQNAINSLKLTCWGFLNNCDIETQTTFAKYLKNIIVNNGISKLWLRYAGMNEYILNHVFEGLDDNQNFTDLQMQRMLLNDTGRCLSKLGKIIKHHIGIERLELGWNMSAIPDIECYTDLLNGIGNNSANLKRIQVYADSKYKLKTLGVLLKKNIILRDITLNIMDWNGTEDDMGNNTGYTDDDLIIMCDKLIDVMVNNQLYLEQQMNAVKSNLKNTCQFPNGLCLNILQYIYPNEEMDEYCLKVEVVMNCEEDTKNEIINKFEDKIKQMNNKLDTDFVKRNLKFKISKPWPG